MSDMTGGSSTHSSSTLPHNVSFDVRKEKDVVALLRHIHQSSLSVEDKNILRDAIFSIQSSGNASVPKELRTLFSKKGFLIIGDDADGKNTGAKNSIPQNKHDVSRYGATRPQPVFTSVSAVPASSVQKTTDIPSQTHSPKAKKSEESLIYAKELRTPKVPKTIVHKVVPQPTTEAKAPQQKKPTAPPSSPPPPEASSPTQYNSATQNSNPIERIKEIKKEVNLLVGNPVNLIAADNTVGREYMNALLDAMKKGNGGNAKEVASAMDRLERAYAAVKKTIAAQKGGIPTATKAPAPKDTEVEVSTPEDMSRDVVSQDSPPQAQVTQTTAPQAAQAPDNIQNVTPASAQVGVAPSVSMDTSPQTQTSTTQDSTQTSQPLSGFASVHQTHIAADTHTPQTPTATPKTALPQTPRHDVVTDAEIQKTTAQTGLKSVAKEKQIQEMLHTQKEQAAQEKQQSTQGAPSSTDPLMTPEVTAGLQQLLSEWSLFKSSGFFGTGGSGMEHPLYQKLANLNMAAIVAGRYEGATPEVKRNISDYMNGWRYEEGILHNHGETFEHYLRRVIRHILDKRKK